jgi:hypothetical protein
MAQGSSGAATAIVDPETGEVLTAERSAWAPSQAQVKRAYAIGKTAGFKSEEVDKLAGKYFRVSSPAHLASKADYDEFTGDEGTLVQAGRRKAAAAQDGGEAGHVIDTTAVEV